jgi:hypothetical protein
MRARLYWLKQEDATCKYVTPHFSPFLFLAKKSKKKIPTENFYGQNMTGMFQISHQSKL